MLISNILSESIKELEGFGGFGFCLSKEGDLLSQWRGYATDGAGVSIGFSRKYLENLAKFTSSSILKKMLKDKFWGMEFRLKEVIYQREQQLPLIKPIYDKLKNFALNNKDESLSQATINLLSHSLVLDLYVLKLEAFEEEKEFRLISILSGSSKIDIKFRSVDKCIIPYMECSLEDLEPEKAITKVILGPKNLTPDYVVRQVLEKNNFKDVEVVSSSATYR